MPVCVQEARQLAYAEVWAAVQSGMLLSSTEACLAVSAAGALQGIAAEHCPRVTQEIHLTLQQMAHDCRSFPLPDRASLLSRVQLPPSHFSRGVGRKEAQGRQKTLECCAC